MTINPIDWSAESHTIGDVTINLDFDDEPRYEEILSSVARAYNKYSDSECHVYCIEYIEDNESYWYVGETSNIGQRLTTHIYERDVRNIEFIEEWPNKQEAREREQIASYEVALAKETTNVRGGR